MSDINQRLLKRKIQKKNQYLNTKLKIKKNYNTMIEKAGYQQIPVGDQNDPMLQKRLNIFNDILAGVDKEESEQKQTERKDRRSKSAIPVTKEDIEIAGKGVGHAKTKEEIEKERKKKDKERQKNKKRLMERTKKGQPVMKNYINSLLQKVQKAVQK